MYTYNLSLFFYEFATATPFIYFLYLGFQLVSEKNFVSSRVIEAVQPILRPLFYIKCYILFCIYVRIYFRSFNTSVRFFFFLTYPPTTSFFFFSFFKLYKLKENFKQRRNCFATIAMFFFSLFMETFIDS